MAIVLKQPKNTQAAVVPNGTYQARLTKVRSFENSYGDRIGFEFTLQDSAVEGLKVMRSTGPNLSPKSKLADLLRGLLGRDLTEGECAKGFDVEQLVGTDCKVLVLQSRGKGGQTYSNVEQVYK
jgi:hypothetical protein